MSGFNVEFSSQESSVEEVAPRPRTVTVLGLLTVAAFVFSYLGAYAVTDALKAAQIIQQWPIGADPRPRWLLVGFIVCMSAFAVLALMFRIASRRQLRRLDALADATEEFRISDN